MFSVLKNNNFLEMVRLSGNFMQQIVDMLQREENQSKISRDLNIGRTTVINVWVKFQQTGLVLNKKKSGRPKKT